MNFHNECISMRSLTLTLLQLFISVSYMPTSPIIIDTNAISSANIYVGESMLESSLRQVPMFSVMSRILVRNQKKLNLVDDVEIAPQCKKVLMTRILD